MSLVSFPAAGVDIAGSAVRHGAAVMPKVVIPDTGIGVARGVKHGAGAAASAKNVVAAEGVAREVDCGAGTVGEAVGEC